MMLRTIVASIRTAAFGRKRQALHDRATARHGLLEPVGSGLAIPDIQQYTARGANGDYTIFVTLPSGPPPGAGYPVLTLLDGNAWIAGAAEALRWQSRFAIQSEIEPMIVVAVGYPGEAPFDLGRRAYDFLPDHSSGKLSERFMQGAPWHQPGGADAFLDFLKGPLRDDLAERYPVDRSRQILCGHSFGGFFALYALLHRPEAFRHYAALSPSLWWDDGRLLKDAEAAIAAMPRDLVTDILIAVGERETPERPKISARMLDDSAAFVDRLERERLAGVSVDYRVLAGENHQSLLTAAFSAVLRFATMNGGQA
ncbi:alpha/beta hydrolase [Sphingobium cloacae]|uniref:Esterase n=1 Tax=Sphingobium cloacae TaxID=120107 RepID=A0A1E1F4J5_9SPHN|nr:alpha/beta hydrolase-fold protein [Sphingobium cloacae]BAV65361.1 hypothetical protein SCLO_1023210 [Sphingobium cloacae]